MNIRRTAHFERAYSKAPAAVQAAFDKQSRLLLTNLKHPSLHAKKYDQGQDLWQARATRSWRFYFMIVGDTYFMLDITPHPK